jgi:ketose-bisphosphate aldolase
MPLVPLKSLLETAQSERYGVGYFESWNLESLQGVLAAAEETNTPVIAGFNGGFLNSSKRGQPERLANYACMKSAIEASTVPVSFLLNETDSLDQIREGLRLGFNAVMPESEGLSLEKYREFVKRVVGLAREKGVAVEAQVGSLANAGNDHDDHSEVTDPDVAAEFVKDTGIDFLAVAVGNIHILTEGKAQLDLDALRRIKERVQVPLVLHGGTSIPLDLNRELVALGVAKFNYGTVLKQAYLQAVKEKLAEYEPPMNPHPFLGIGGQEDIMSAGRKAVTLKVKEIIASLKPNGR